MKRKSFGEMSCPIALGLDRVGDGWGFLILRDALNGMTQIGRASCRERVFALV